MDNIKIKRNGIMLVLSSPSGAGKSSVAKKLVKRPSTKTKTSQPEVKAPKGMISVSCPSCSKVHTVDENTTKFICSCGRRIRV